MLTSKVVHILLLTPLLRKYMTFRYLCYFLKNLWIKVDNCE